MELYKYKMLVMDPRLDPYFCALRTLTCKKGYRFNYGVPLNCTNNHRGYQFNIKKPYKRAFYTYPKTLIDCFLVDIILVN